MRQTLLTWLVLLVACYAVYAGLLYATQRSLMFPAAASDWPRRSRVATPGWSEVQVPASFGAVRVLYRPAPDAKPGAALIYLHGNAEFADDNVDSFPALAAQGVHLALIEYPGYAGAAGAPTFDSLREAATVTYDWLRQRPDVDAARIVAAGRSVGTGPAAELSAHRTLRALVLMSPFTSVADFACARGLPAFLVRDPFDNRARLRAYAGPVLILHGRHDEIIPYAHGRALAAVAHSATLRDYPCGHNDCPWFEPEFEATLLGFLHRHGILTAPGTRRVGSGRPRATEGAMR
jgi:hypothetical protein